MKEERLLIFCGDIHGELKKLVWKLTVQLDLKNCDVIICGDFGIGFEKPSYLDLLYKEVESRLEKNDINLYVVRGNHDDPSYFKDSNFNKPRLIFLIDHHPIELSGKIIYPIGGATSVDKVARIEMNNKFISKNQSKRVWWKDEEIIKKFEDLPTKVDILVSHEAPISFLPFVDRGDLSYEIYNSIVDQRRYLDWVLNELKPKYWYHGHYHKSTSGDQKGVIYRGLDIEELIELKFYE